MFDEKLYDELFAEADAFVKEVNPCKVVNGECLRKYKFNQQNFCCRGCRHLRKTGCTANKPLSCRIWLCNYAWYNLTPEQQTRQKEIQNKIEKADLWLVRATKEDMIKFYQRYTNEREEQE